MTVRLSEEALAVLLRHAEAKARREGEPVRPVTGQEPTEATDPKENRA